MLSPGADHVSAAADGADVAGVVLGGEFGAQADEDSPVVNDEPAINLYQAGSYPVTFNALQGASTYNALQIKAQRRFAHGASINLAYTWSKLLSNTDTQTTWLESGSLTVAQDYNNLRAEKSLSANDTPQRVVVSYIYDLPVGRGRKYLGDSSGFVNGTLGGWGIEGITTLQSGFPLQFGTNTNLTNSYGGGSRPNYVAGCNKEISGRAQSRLNEWFNTACFTAPPAFTFGDEPRYDPQLRAAGQATWDTSAFKNIPLLPETQVGPAIPH